jgi:hypothetical protein
MKGHSRFMATMVGSMPLTDADTAIDIILKHIKEAPAWPQLPKTGLNEQMEIQYSESLPCVVIDRQKNRLYFDTSEDYSEVFAAFYEVYLAAMDPDEGNGDCSALAISPHYAQGIYALEQRLQQQSIPLSFIKVQTTGPCTFALSTTDENKRAIYYNEVFRDVIVKALAMKCRWQIQKFKPYASRIICFIDEPILSAFGSSTYVSVRREDIVAHLSELIDAIHADGALAGIHCCGNTEWSILVDAGVDILNFDAFEFGDSLTIYPEAIKNLLARGGSIAWGIVPTSAAIREQTVEGLAGRLNQTMEQLITKGIDRNLLIDRAIITPSCGTGSMLPVDAIRVFEMTDALSTFLKTEFN